MACRVRVLNRKYGSPSGGVRQTRRGPRGPGTAFGGTSRASSESRGTPPGGGGRRAGRLEVGRRRHAAVPGHAYVEKDSGHHVRKGDRAERGGACSKDAARGGGHGTRPASPDQ